MTHISGCDCPACDSSLSSCATVTGPSNWKLNATAAERFEELSQLAREHPERFARFIVIWEPSYERPCRAGYASSEGLTHANLIYMLTREIQLSFIGD